MREIKFRGKRIDNSEWVHGDILSGVGGGKYIVTLVDDVGTWQSNPRLLHAKVDPDTVGQYTGLKDKHGKEIYEGDIIKGNKSCLIVIFYKGMFSGKQQGTNYSEPLALWEMQCFENIGNVHDNPELIAK
jgi:hypothetical protein